MIRFENLTKSFRIRGTRKMVIDDLSLELPSGKSIGVKAKPAKVIRDVLGPILLQVRKTA